MTPRGCRRVAMWRGCIMLASAILCAMATLSRIPHTMASNQGTWTPTGSMNVARAAFAATLLQNGKVLVAGGVTTGSIPLAIAELYDPSTGRWSSTGSMDVTRVLPAIVLLQNGKVLVAGGDSSLSRGGPHLASAELYDPNTGIWSPTGSMSVARLLNSVTLLPNGKVLAAGALAFGTGGAVLLPSADLYDPAMGTWSPTGSMNIARSAHTATLLQDGKVLVAGGGGFGASLADSEVYNPSSGTWSPTGAMDAARAFHTATLLRDGKVLVAGGAYDSSSSIGLSSADLYDPDTGSWILTGALNVGRAGQTATLLQNGTILVVGGYTANFAALASAESYDPHTGRWSPTSPAHIGRIMHTATLLPDGDVLVTGGASGYIGSNVANDTVIMGSAELYHGASAAKTGGLSAAPVLVLFALVVVAVGLAAVLATLLRRHV